MLNINMLKPKVFIFLFQASLLLGDVVFPLQSGQVGNRMVTMDSNGQRVKLACVNWYGAHMEDMVVNGLDRQPIANIAGKIAELGFNFQEPCHKGRASLRKPRDGGNDCYGSF